MFVIPNVDVVLIPERGMTVLPAEGAEVPDTLYWRKRLACGDVRLGQPPASKPDSKPVTSEKTAEALD